MFYAIAVIPNEDLPGPLSDSLDVPGSALYLDGKAVDWGMTSKAQVGYRLEVAAGYRDTFADEFPGDTHSAVLVMVKDNGKRFEVVLGSYADCAI